MVTSDVFPVHYANKRIKNSVSKLGFSGGNRLIECRTSGRSGSVRNSNDCRS